MRLIDADTLLTQIKYKPVPNIIDETWNELYERVIEEIDNAPTIKTFTLLDIEEQYHKGLEKGLSERETERPKGKWIESISDDPYMITYGWRCSVCGKRQTHGTPKYCMHCGSKMEE